MKRLPGTWCGFLQRVPAVEGPLFLLAQVGAMLEQPMGDPALADPWRAASHQITKVFCKKRVGTIYTRPLEKWKQQRGEESLFFTS